jgi:hypothetical protein
MRPQGTSIYGDFRQFYISTLTNQFSKRDPIHGQTGTLAVFPSFSCGYFLHRRFAWIGATGSSWTSNCGDLILPDATTIKTIAPSFSVFFAGVILGGILFAPEIQPMRIASNYAAAAMAFDDNGTCRIRSHPPAGSVAPYHFSRLG